MIISLFSRSCLFWKEGRKETKTRFPLFMQSIKGGFTEDKMKMAVWYRRAFLLVLWSWTQLWGKDFDSVSEDSLTARTLYIYTVEWNVVWLMNLPRSSPQDRRRHELNGSFRDFWIQLSVEHSMMAILQLYKLPRSQRSGWDDGKKYSEWPKVFVGPSGISLFIRRWPEKSLSSSLVVIIMLPDAC